MSKPHPETKRRSPRPWVVPPGLLLQDEPYEGFYVLEETRSELGVLLWQSLRDVDLWSEARPEALEQRDFVVVVEGIDNLVGKANKTIHGVNGVAQFSFQAKDPERKGGAVSVGGHPAAADGDLVK